MYVLQQSSQHGEEYLRGGREGGREGGRGRRVRAGMGRSSGKGQGRERRTGEEGERNDLDYHIYKCVLESYTLPFGTPL